MLRTLLCGYKYQTAIFNYCRHTWPVGIHCRHNFRGSPWKIWPFQVLDFQYGFSFVASQLFSDVLFSSFFYIDVQRNYSSTWRSCQGWFSHNCNNRYHVARASQPNLFLFFWRDEFYLMPKYNVDRSVVRCPQQRHRSTGGNGLLGSLLWEVIFVYFSKRAKGWSFFTPLLRTFCAPRFAHHWFR